jgi:hypothetical protein
MQAGATRHKREQHGTSGSDTAQAGAMRRDPVVPIFCRVRRKNTGFVRKTIQEANETGQEAEALSRCLKFRCIRSLAIACLDKTKRGGR